MKKLVGKVVSITEVCYNTAARDNAPFEFEYEGQVAEVDGHMIKIVNCRITRQPFGYPHPGTRWFNTMSNTLKSIDEK